MGARLAGASPSKARDHRGGPGAQEPRHQPGASSFRFISMLGGPVLARRLSFGVVSGPSAAGVQHAPQALRHVVLCSR